MSLRSPQKKSSEKLHQKKKRVERPSCASRCWNLDGHPNCYSTRQYHLVEAARERKPNLAKLVVVPTIHEWIVQQN
ncbi:unnamed protein product [Nezara viridula]|uniref:Uncharacterized protein n=1 Tax=Nezara viridula TaxID=85310 RepID=A0A9P0HQD7_NEZVI|nr:unnamed protein product [Nezara viridula]